MKFNWVTFHVSDLEKSLFFYNKLLNIEISSRFDTENLQIVMLGNENEAKLELIFEQNVKIENAGKGVSIGLEIEGLDTLIATLKQHNYKVTGPISPNPHIRFFIVQDSDEYTIQLIDKKKD